MVLYACSKKNSHTVAKRDLDVTPASEVALEKRKFKYPPMGAVRLASSLALLLSRILTLV